MTELDVSRLRHAANRRAMWRLVLWWAIPFLVVLGVLAMAYMTGQIESRAQRTSCPTAQVGSLDCVGGLAPSSLTLELAGSGHQLVCQLHPEHMSMPTPTVAERMCVEARIQQRWDELARLDKQLFMPLYGGLSLLLAAWIALHAPRKTPFWGTGHRSAVGIVISTLLLLALDSIENKQAMALLVASERGSLVSSAATRFDDAAAQARWASLAKWAATVIWTALLAWGLSEWQPRSRRLARWPGKLSILALVLASLSLAAGVAVGAFSVDIAGPVHWLRAGFNAAFVGSGAATLAIVFSPPDKIPRRDSRQLSPPEPSSRIDIAVPYLKNDKIREFHLEEYRQLRGEVIGLMTRIEQLFRGAIVVSALGFTWLVTSSLGVDVGKTEVCLKLPRELLWFGWFIPPSFVLCTALVSWITFRRVTETGGYLYQLERALGHRLLGWEAYLSRLSGTVTLVTGGMWFLLFFLSAVASVIGLATVGQAIVGCEAKRWKNRLQAKVF